jgi:hypothetical protein
VALVLKGVAASHPWRPLGVARGQPHWLGVAPCFFFLNFNFFLKNKYIYLFFNKFIFFIKMDTCHHLIGDTWHLTESVKKFNRI